MKKVLFLSVFIYGSSVFADNLSLNKGWHLLGTSEDINTSSYSNKNKDISLLWSYDNNKSTWGAYTPNMELKSKIKEQTKSEIILKVHKKSGYWIFLEKDSNISVDSNTTNLDIFDLNKGWQLLGSNNDLNISKFKNTCADYLWSYEGSSQKWKLFIANNKSYNITNVETINKLNKNSGFWVNANSSCEVNTTKIQDLNKTLSIPKLIDAPQSTSSDKISLKIEAQKDTKLYVNQKEFLTIPSSGVVVIDLNTSGEDGNKTFEIYIKDENQNKSEVLIYNIIKKAITRADAKRFLRQATFSSSEEDLEYIIKNGYESWIDEQYKVVGDLDNNEDEKYGYLESIFRFLNKVDPTLYPTTLFTEPEKLDESKLDGKRLSAFRGSVFWDKALNSKDQLRQRIAYALSQILVVSDRSPAGQIPAFRAETLATYYDILYKHSYGNYRNLLSDVTYSSAMGFYLTYTGSKKDAPDENYARELTQLFTIGLYELNEDGSKKLNNGKEIPTYTQEHVTNLAEVFTGWDLKDFQVNNKGKYLRYGAVGKTDGSWLSSLEFNPKYHDSNKSKTILGDKVIPAGLSGKDEVEKALDFLFEHKNVAPFISKHLILRLVTSNPTPQYIQRVAKVFNDNGQGVKGDLRAVVKAILLDKEARQTPRVENFGKVDEMLISFSHFLKAFKANPVPKMTFTTGAVVEDVYWLSPDKVFGQAILGADSVFNFYSNEFIPSAKYFADNKVVSPELQIQTSPNLIGYSNLIEHLLLKKEKYALVDLGKYSTIEEWADARAFGQFSLASGLLYMDLSEEYILFEKALDNEDIANKDFINMGGGTTNNEHRTRAIKALIEHLDNKLFGKTMPQTYKDAILEHVETFDYNKNNTNRVNRAKAIVTTTIRAIVTSPLFMVLK